MSAYPQEDSSKIIDFAFSYLLSGSISSILLVLRTFVWRRLILSAVVPLTHVFIGNALRSIRACKSSLAAVHHVLLTDPRSFLRFLVALIQITELHIIFLNARIIGEVLLLYFFKKLSFFQV